MSAEHTPTPWAYVTCDGRPQIIKASDCGSFAQEICEICGHGSESDDVANAEFIVRCVNAHDEMVAALDDARSYVNSAAMFDADRRAKDVVRDIDAALAKAGGRS